MDSTSATATPIQLFRCSGTVCVFSHLLRTIVNTSAKLSSKGTSLTLALTSYSSISCCSILVLFQINISPVAFDFNLDFPVRTTEIQWNAVTVSVKIITFFSFHARAMFIPRITASNSDVSFRSHVACSTVVSPI